MLGLRFQPYDMNLLQLICFEESTEIFSYITEVLTDDSETKLKMAQHRDTNMGSQAIHLAATTGNSKILNTLIKEFKADAHQITSLSKQTVHHCAAQKYNGILSILLFAKAPHFISVQQTDNNDATALHFAAIHLNLKSLQALIKLGSDVNAQDNEGNTPLHLCIKLLGQDPKHFDQLK